MSNVLETRELWSHGELTITGQMIADDSGNMPDFSDYPDGGADYRAHLERGDFMFAGMAVTVTYAGVEIGLDSLWGIEHGQVGTVGEAGFTGPGNPGDPVNADAWEFTPPDYDGNTVIMGSPLAGVIDEAISRARTWADGYGTDAMRAALLTAEAWADPNAHKRAGAS